jgi:lipoate-protein ligase A
MTIWRLIPLIEASGTIQMAIDRWLLQQHRQGKHPPVLRFYTWFPAAISLGYHQSQYPAHWQQLTWQNNPVELVHRPTGGRAVLHQGDLTYMLVTSGLEGERIEVYQTLCQFLLLGWRSLGVELHYGSGGRGYIHNPNCFASATKGDLLTADGYKLIGSAQLRQGKAILQHGSMSLYGNQELFKQVFGDFYDQKAVFSGLKSESEQITMIIDSLIQAAGKCFGVEFEHQPLLESEWQEIKEFVSLLGKPSKTCR